MPSPSPRVRALAVYGGDSPLVQLPSEHSDGETYVTTKTAAALLGVKPCTITHWRTAGYLQPVDGSPPRRPLYRWTAVLEAEHAAWQAALRTAGTDVQIRRRSAAA